MKQIRGNFLFANIETEIEMWENEKKDLAYSLKMETIYGVQ